MSTRLPSLIGPLLIGGAMLGRPLLAQDHPHAITVPLSGRRVLATVENVPVYNGGFGSGLTRDPRTGHWLALTDRGPNFDVAEDVKGFPVPAYQPMVGRFRLVGRGKNRSLVLVERIPLRARDGTPIVGLPNPPGAGATGERAVGLDGSELPPTPKGLDPEAIHALVDGTFWVADEYGPSLVHFDRSGRELERVSPYTAPKALPRILAARRPNRGFEGLTGSADGAKLFAILQSPLDNPKAAGRASRYIRIVVYHPSRGAAEQYLYPVEDARFFVGDLTLLPDGTLLVLENDGTPPGPTSHRRIYRIDLSGATPIGDESADETTIESLDSAGLARRSIAPATKTLVADLGKMGYRHDKPEGILALGPNEIAVINDDDFGISEGPNGLPIPKRLLGLDGPVDRNEVWIVRLPTALWKTPRPLERR